MLSQILLRILYIAAMLHEFVLCDCVSIMVPRGGTHISDGDVRMRRNC